MIELKNIKKYYKMGDTTVKALDDVSLKIEDGEFVTIIGPSGSGKSTMMNIIGCLDKATSGQYLVDGIEISKYTENKLAYLRNKKMGFIFQGFNLLQNLSAYENVELPLIYQGVSKSERKRRVNSSLEMVGMKERMKHKPTELSGGQQQRVAIARALATKPMCILADEPTGNLDSVTGNEIMKILRDLNKKGTTIVIITHNDEIASMSRRVVRIHDGKIDSDVINENISLTENTENDFDIAETNSSENLTESDEVSNENKLLNNLSALEENSSAENSNTDTNDNKQLRSGEKLAAVDINLDFQDGQKIKIRSKKTLKKDKPKEEN